MEVIKLLASNNFITFNRDLAKLVGLEAAIMLGELASEQSYWMARDGLEDGYFFSTLENIEDKTTLSRKKQDKAIKMLKDKGIIQVKVRGCPAKRYFKINEYWILRLLSGEVAEDVPENPDIEDGANQFDPTGQYSLSERDKLDCPKRTSNKTKDNKTKEKECIHVSQVVKMYNEICKSLPRAEVISDKRKQLINARLKTYSLDKIREVFEKAEKSAFLRGETGRPSFKPGIDWLLNETNMIKVLEGNYDDKPGGGGGVYVASRSDTLRMAEQLAESQQQRAQREWVEENRRLAAEYGMS